MNTSRQNLDLLRDTVAIQRAEQIKASIKSAPSREVLPFAGILKGFADASLLNGLSAAFVRHQISILIQLWAEVTADAILSGLDGQDPVAPFAADAIAELCASICGRLSLLPADVLSRAAEHRSQWPVVVTRHANAPKALGSKAFLRTKGKLPSMATPVNRWAFVALGAMHLIRATPKSCIGTLTTDGQPRPSNITADQYEIVKGLAALAPKIFALPELTTTTARQWADTAFPVFETIYCKSLDLIPGLNELGKYRQKKNANVTGKSVGVKSNVKDGIRERFRKAVKSLAPKASPH
jgi:hypothetical protein